MSNIIAAMIICYGLMSITFATLFTPQSDTDSYEERAARLIGITFWPITVYGTIHIMLEAKEHEPSDIKDVGQ